MEKKTNCTYIGGQAVIEGVMMRGKRAMATVVRDENGDLHTEARRVKPPEERSRFSRAFFVRGIVNFVSSLAVGMGALMRSSDAALASFRALQNQRGRYYDDAVYDRRHCARACIVYVLPQLVYGNDRKSRARDRQPRQYLVQLDRRRFPFADFFRLRAFNAADPFGAQNVYVSRRRA